MTTLKTSILGNGSWTDSETSTLAVDNLKTRKRLPSEKKEYLKSWVNTAHLNAHFMLLEILKWDEVPTYTSLSTDEATALVKNFSSLVFLLPLQGLKEITPEVAQIIGVCKWRIDLSGIPVIPQEVLTVFRNGKATIVHRGEILVDFPDEKSI
jgi:hypothetical protein